MNRREVLLALGAAAAGALCTYTTARALHWRNGTYLQMGTSITSGVTAKAGRTPMLVGEQLGMVGINAGLPGAFAGRSTTGRSHRSLCSLVDAITSGDWTAQQAETDPTCKAHIAELATTDLSKVNVLGLEYGPNDYAYDVPVGDRTDCDDRTFKGSLNYSLSKLSASFPKLKMFMITPAWRLNPKELDSDTNPNGIGLFLKDYVDAMIQVAERHHIPCLDLWRTFGINIDNYKALTYDGTHPNDECAIRRAEVIASFVEATF